MELGEIIKKEKSPKKKKIITWFSVYNFKFKFGTTRELFIPLRRKKRR